MTLLYKEDYILVVEPVILYLESTNEEVDSLKIAKIDINKNSYTGIHSLRAGV